MDSRRYAVSVEQHRFLQGFGVLIVLINLCGIVAWSLGVLNLSLPMLPSITSLQLAALLTSVLLLGLSLEIGRPRMILDNNGLSWWAGCILLIAALLTVFGVSPLIYEGIRITSYLP